MHAIVTHILKLVHNYSHDGREMTITTLNLPFIHGWVQVVGIPLPALLAVPLDEQFAHVGPFDSAGTVTTTRAQQKRDQKGANIAVTKNRVNFTINYHLPTPPTIPRRLEQPHNAYRSSYPFVGCFLQTW